MVSSSDLLAMSLEGPLAKDISSLYNIIVGYNKLRSVLLIDDDTPLCEFLQKYFQKRDVDLKFCGNLKNSREALRFFTPDVLLLDLTLPDGNGFHFLSYLKDKKIENSFPIVIFTSSSESEEELKKKLAPYGPCEIIKKPIWPDQLMRKLEKIVS